MADLQSIGTVVAIICGVGGLTISVATYITTRRDREPHIEVKADIGMPLSGRAEEAQVYVAAVNTGIRSVRIEEIGAYLPDGKKFVFYLPQPLATSDPLPCDLSEGQKCQQCLPIEVVAQTLQKQGYGTGVALVGYARDAQGKHHRGNPFPFDPPQWLTTPSE